MKFKIQKKIVISLILIIILSFTFTKVNKKLRANNKMNQPGFRLGDPIVQAIPQSQMMNFFASNAKAYVPFARLAYCQRPVIEKFSCSFCNNFTLGHYNTFYIHTVIQNPNLNFKLVILYSDIKKEIVISFSGPGSEHGTFFTSIYLNGFVLVPEIGNLKVERVYWNIYNQNFRLLLIEKIRKFLSFGRADYKFIFVGHSFGGSIATLASYDLIFNRIIPKNPIINSPQIFTYGQLRIGDNAYINKLNTELKIIRIIRKGDFIAQMPNCVFVNSAYKCFDNTQSLINVMPQIKTYIDGCGNPQRFLGFLEMKNEKIKKTKKDPIIRGTTMIGGNLVPTHTPIFYTQPLGTELFYPSPNFDKYERCNYVNGIPICEKSVKVPLTVSPEVHRIYYNMNMELC